MGFNSALKGLKLLKKTGNGRLNNLNDVVINVLMNEENYVTTGKEKSWSTKIKMHRPTNIHEDVTILDRFTHCSSC